MNATRYAITREWADTTVAMALASATAIGDPARKAELSVVAVDGIFADVRGNRAASVPFTKADVMRVMVRVMTLAAGIIRAVEDK